MIARPDLLAAALHDAVDKAEAALNARDKRIAALVERLEQLEARLLELAGDRPRAADHPPGEPSTTPSEENGTDA